MNVSIRCRASHTTQTHTHTLRPAVFECFCVSCLFSSRHVRPGRRHRGVTWTGHLLRPGLNNWMVSGIAADREVDEAMLPAEHVLALVWVFFSPLMIKITQRWVSLSWWLSLALTHSNYSGVYSQQTHSHATDRKVAPRAEKRWQERAKRCLFQRPPGSFRYILERGFIPPLKNHRRWMQNKKFTLPITSPFWPITSSNLVSDRFFNQSLLQIDSVWNRVVWTNRRPASAAQTTPCFLIISVFFRVYFYSWRCTNISVPRMLKRNKTEYQGKS